MNVKLTFAVIKITSTSRHHYVGINVNRDILRQLAAIKHRRHFTEIFSKTEMEVNDRMTNK